MTRCQNPECPHERVVGRPKSKLSPSVTRARLLAILLPGETLRVASRRLGYNPQRLCAAARLGASEAAISEWERLAATSQPQPEPK